MTDKTLREAAQAVVDAINRDELRDEVLNLKAALAAPEPEGDIGPRTPENSMVICPNCTCQFTAISVDDQARMSALAAENERLRNQPCPLVHHETMCPQCDHLRLEAGELRARIRLLERATSGVEQGRRP